ncbi:MAG TPA: monofunctional biosynthetic peptidoglycan transglycosylase [Candidatus Sphingobacterium stercorigallinarum]|nr:monofunctional biosynthetic peptidoglycan transglycosylase [Candidatus Sphingobacterium stercorigallinarum]
MAIKRSKTRRKRRRSPSLRQQLKSKVLPLLIKTVLFCFLGSLVWVIALRFITPPITYLMLKRGFERQASGKEWKIDKKWVDYADISDNLKRAAIAGEDAHFLTHRGFDRNAIVSAFQRNRAGDGPLRGGSTISQQTAKNVFLWPARSWIRKGLESYFTVLIEIFWGKKRILEVYLNVIEMGQGVYGAAAASTYYFKKDVKGLTRKESALIIAILPNPRSWDAKRPSAFVNRRANNIVRYLNYYEIPD